MAVVTAVLEAVAVVVVSTKVEPTSRVAGLGCAQCVRLSASERATSSRNKLNKPAHPANLHCRLLNYHRNQPKNQHRPVRTSARNRSAHSAFAAK